MTPSPREAAQRWVEATRGAALTYTAGVDAIEVLKAAYVAESMTMEEFEAEVGRLRAGEAQ